MADSTSRPRSHVARPEIFDGKGFLTFMRSVNLYLIANKKEFPDDASKIVFVLSYMKAGHADTWAENFTDEANDKNDFGTWDDFKVALKRSFADPNLTKHAVDKLESMTQGRQSADEFFQHFETYRRQAGYTSDKGSFDDYLIRILERNMNRDLVTRVHAAENVIDTYDKFKDRAMRQDAIMRRLEDIPQPKKPTPTHSTRPHAPSPAQFTPRPPQPVEKRTSSGMVFGGSGQPMDVDKARMRGRCYLCGTPGHRQFDCPNRNKEQIRQMVSEMTPDVRNAWLEELGVPADQPSKEAKSNPTGF